MAYQFKLPDIGEGIAAGEIVKWFVKPGDTINEDDTLLGSSKRQISRRNPHL